MSNAAAAAAKVPRQAPLAMPLGPLMVDLSGETMRAEEMDFLRHPAVGAVILFARNYRSKTQVRGLVDEIKALRAPALLVAVDQEGGRVQRFRDGFYPLPAPGRLGELYDRDREQGLAMAETAACLMATEVLQTGVDFSFAPMLDCRGPPNPVIGARAFHRDPAVIGELANAYIRGMNRAGMVATGKHFPGHGGVTADSHRRLPVDARSLAELQQRDLMPFQSLAKRLGGIMTAHVLFERIHAQPPTYSSFWLQRMLRRELRFNGVIFSDDLSMKGAAAELDMPVRSLAALNAGCDMALICNAPSNARRAADHIAQEYGGDSSRLPSMKAKGKGKAATPAALAQMAAALDAAWG